MRRALRLGAPALFLALGILALPAYRRCAGTRHGGRCGEGPVRRRAARRDRGSVESGAHRESPGSVTDGTGLYRIVNLPPGSYTVTFTLPGSTPSGAKASRCQPASRRSRWRDAGRRRPGDGHGDRRESDRRRAVGGADAVGDREAFKEIPSSGSWLQMASLVPAIRASYRTSAACWATRPARRCRRTAAAPRTACR